MNFEFIKSKLSDSIRWGDIEKTDERFERMMVFYKENFELS